MSGVHTAQGYTAGMPEGVVPTWGIHSGHIRGIIQFTEPGRKIRGPIDTKSYNKVASGPNFGNESMLQISPEFEVHAGFRL